MFTFWVAVAIHDKAFGYMSCLFCFFRAMVSLSGSPNTAVIAYVPRSVQVRSVDMGSFWCSSTPKGKGSYEGTGPRTLLSEVVGDPHKAWALANLWVSEIHRVEDQREVSRAV